MRRAGTFCWETMAQLVADVRKTQERLRAQIVCVLEGKSGIRGGEGERHAVTVLLHDVLQYIEMERTVGAYLTLRLYAAETATEAVSSEAGSVCAAELAAPGAGGPGGPGGPG